MTTAAIAPDLEIVQQVATRVVTDQSGAMVIALASIGDKLGLFRALEEHGPTTSTELAARLGLNERYVREWLRAMVAAEYIEYDEQASRYYLTAEQALVMANENSPVFMGGAFQFTIPTVQNVPRILDAFRRGGGVPYDEMGSDLCCAMERFFRPGYRHELISAWLPAIPGLVERLEAGIDVLDVGCGRGQSTVCMAQAFPASRFVGVDYHGDSIAGAMKLAHDNGITNARFVQASADQVERGKGYHLVCAFDCIHDMIDPVATLRTVREVLDPNGGFFLWAEPNASHEAHRNRNPFGRLFHAVSPLHCMTVSLAHNGAGLGTVIGEQGARELAEAAGFRTFTRLDVASPVNQFFCLQ